MFILVSGRRQISYYSDDFVSNCKALNITKPVFPVPRNSKVGPHHRQYTYIRRKRRIPVYIPLNCMLRIISFACASLSIWPSSAKWSVLTPISWGGIFSCVRYWSEVFWLQDPNSSFYIIFVTFSAIFLIVTVMSSPHSSDSELALSLSMRSLTMCPTPVLINLTAAVPTQTNKLKQGRSRLVE